MRLAIIVPTVGRDTLTATLESVASQTQVGDHVLVMVDEPTKFLYCLEIVQRIRESGSFGRWSCIPPAGQLGGYGGPQRNRAIAELLLRPNPPGHVWTLDDDDVAAPEALELIRAAIENDPARLHLFQWRYDYTDTGGHERSLTRWQQREITVGNVGNSMAVAPLRIAARWGDRYEQDFDYIAAAAAELGTPIWHQHVIAILRPHDHELIPTGSYAGILNDQEAAA